METVISTGYRIIIIIIVVTVIIIIIPFTGHTLHDVINKMLRLLIKTHIVEAIRFGIVCVGTIDDYTYVYSAAS